MKNHSFIDHVEAINSSFSDSGLFGIRVSGAAANVSSDLA